MQSASNPFQILDVLADLHESVYPTEDITMRYFLYAL
jgi:hypothetical protein